MYAVLFVVVMGTALWPFAGMHGAEHPWKRLLQRRPDKWQGGTPRHPGGMEESVRTPEGRVLDTSALRSDVRSSYLWAVPSVVMLVLGLLVARTAVDAGVSTGALSIPLMAVAGGVLGLAHNAWVRWRANSAPQRVAEVRGVPGKVTGIGGNVAASRFLRVYLEVEGESLTVPLVSPRGATLPGPGTRVRCHRNGRTMAVVDGTSVHWSF